VSRAERSGISLTEEDAAIVKGMLARGDRQHDIAAWFGVNGGRIAEISSQDKFRYVQAKHDNLPPTGPYVSGKASDKARQEIIEIRQSLNVLISKIDDIINNI
jgi:hypothetical protein